MSSGRVGEILFRDKMLSLNYQVQDVSGDSNYWYRDIDFIATSPTTGLTKTFEVKWDSRINSTGNLYLELSNVHSKGGKGWFNFCEADYVAYGDAAAQCFYIIPLDKLKERAEQLPQRMTHCGTDSIG